jgi:hypothetical protein
LRGAAELPGSQAGIRAMKAERAAPVNNNLEQAFVGRHVLGLPRSY